LPRGRDGGGGTYGFIIRERTISSWPIGDEERKVMKQWDEESRGGFTTRMAAEHEQKRLKAREIDRAKRAAADQTKGD
jgi:hypothetical protein